MRTPYETGGYDLVVQVSEREYNDQLAALFAAGSPQFPHQVRRTFNLGLASGTVNFLFDTPWLSFATDPQDRRAVARYEWGIPDASLSIEESAQVTFCLPFSEANLVLNDRIDPHDIDGCVLVQESVSVHIPENHSDQREVVLNFDDGVERVEVGFTPETANRLAAESSVDILPALLRGQIQTEVTELLTDDVKQIPLSPQPITVSDDDNPVTPDDIEAKVLRTGGNALAFLVSTRMDSAGDATLIDRPNTTGSEPVAILFDADTLLSGVICPALAAGLDTTEEAFETPCRLRRAVDLDTSDVDELDDLDMDWLTAKIVNDHIEIRGGFEGHGKVQGFPFDVDGDFLVRVFFELSDGELDIRIEADDPNVDITFPWYVYAAGVAIGALTGGVLGVVIAGTIVLVADVVADSIAEKMVGGMFAEQMGGMGEMNVPLGPAADGFELTEVDLTEDALALGGRPIRESGMPVAARGHETRHAGGAAIDLDTGTVGTRGSLPDGVDLVWGTGRSGGGIYARSSAQFAPLASSTFRALTVVDLEQAEFEASPYRTFLPASLVPQQLRFPWGGDSDGLVFAVRTSENRYAKCLVSQRNGRLSLTYVTYDRPTPDVEIELDSVVIDSEQIESGTDTWPTVSCTPSFGFGGRRVGGGIQTESNSEEYTIDGIKRRVTATAQPSLLAYPLGDIQWQLAGENIDGTGSIILDDHTVTYDVDGRNCFLTTELGKHLSGYLSVAITDDRGLEVRDDRWISYDGKQKTGGMSPGAVEDARTEIDRCMHAAHDRFPGGAQPDPMPPWAADGLTQPGALLDALTQPGAIFDDAVLVDDTERSPHRVDPAVVDDMGGTKSKTFVTNPDNMTRLRSLSLDDDGLRAALERGMDVSLRG